MRSDDGVAVPTPVAAVIPAHNGASIIRRAVASVQAQTRPVAEIIVVDDGSTDGTADIVAQMATADPRIRVLRRSVASGGPATPRNLGIASARADWIAFLDQDDEWLPTKMERQLPHLHRPIDVVYSSAVWEAGTKWLPFQLKPILPDNPLETLAHSDEIPMLTAVASRPRLLAVGGFDASPAFSGVEDWHLWIKIALAGGRFFLVDEPLARYYRTEGSLSSPTEAHVRAQRALLERLLEQYPGVLEFEASWARGFLRRATQRVQAVRDPDTRLSAAPGLLIAALREDHSLATIRFALRSLAARLIRLPPHRGQR